MISFKKTLIFPVLFMFLLTANLDAGADVEIEHAYPMNHIHSLGRWNNVLVNLKNTGAKTDELTASFSVSTGMTTVDYRQRFFMPAESQRLLAYPVRFADSESYEIRLSDDRGRNYSEYEVLSRHVSAHQISVLLLDDDDVLPSVSFDSEGFPPHIGRLAGMRINPRIFPSHPAGLDNFELIMIGDINFDLLHPAQVEALDHWVRMGGVLVIFPRPEILNSGAGFLKDFLPALPFDTRKESVYNLDFKNYKSENIKTESYYDLIEMEPLSGTETISEFDGIPLIVKAEHGLGSVFAVACHGKVIDSMAQRRQLFLDFVNSGTIFRPMTGSRFQDATPLHMDRVAGTEVPGRGTVFAIIGGFILISAVLLIITHIFGRGEWAWAVIICISFLLMGVAYRISSVYRQRVGLSLNEIAILYANSGQTDFTREALLGLHTPRSIRAEMIGADTFGAKLTADFIAAEEGRVIRRNVEIADQFSVTNLRLSEGDFPRFYAKSTHQMEAPINVVVNPTEVGMEAVIENESDISLQGGILVINGYPFTVGRLYGGKSKKIELNDRSAGARWEFTTQAILGPEAQTKKDILTDMFRPASHHHDLPWVNQLFFIAWTPDDMNFVQEEAVLSGIDELDIRSLSFVTVKAAIGRPRTGESVLIPAAFSLPALRVGTRTTARSLDSIDTTLAMPSAEIVFYLPQMARTIDLENGILQLKLDTGGQSMELKSSQDDDAETLKILRGTEDRFNIKLDDLSDLYHPEDNTVRIQLSLNEDNESADAALRQQSHWRVRNALLSVKGTAK